MSTMPPKRTASKHPTPPKPQATATKLRTFAEVGRVAAKAAQRKHLLKTLRAQGWNLTGTATALEMSSPSNVLRAIATLDLTAEYEAAKAAGKVSPGNRTAK